MSSPHLLDLCSSLLDKVAVLKGYVQLDIERKKVDYHMVLLNQISDLEETINRLVDEIKRDSGE